MAEQKTSIEFKDFNLGFRQCTSMYHTKSIEIVHKIWDSFHKIWDSRKHGIPLKSRLETIETLSKVVGSSDTQCLHCIGTSQFP